MIPVPAEGSVLLQLEAQMQQPSRKTAVEEKRLLSVQLVSYKLKQISNSKTIL